MHQKTKYYINKIKELENQLEEKDIFLASMSHEIRTPMNAILAISDMLLEEKTLNEKQNEDIKTISNSSKILLGIINDILDYSKIGAGKLKLEKISFDINMVLDYVGDMISMMAQEKKLDIVFDIGTNVKAKYIGDPLRLSQILLNLMSNAVKFTKKGSVTLKIRNLNPENTDSSNLLFEVMDTGIGIAPKNISNLFNEYIQAEDSITRNYGGSGLGLNISKKLTKLMNGEIWVESELDKGSTFFVNISFEISSPNEHRVYRLDSTEIMKKKVLIIDSKEKWTNVLKNMLSYFHIDTTITSTPQEASKTITTDKFDIVFIADYTCNCKDLEFLHNYKDIKIIIIKNWQFTLKKEFQEKFDVITYIKRPFNQQVLCNTLNTLYYKQEKKQEVSKKDLKTIPHKKILIVEDDLINQKIMLNLFKDTNCEITLANNGQEAINIISKEFDLVLMDIKMPILNGYDASKIIRERFSQDQLPIVALTGNTSQEDIAKTKEYGMQYYLAKPLDIKTFYKLMVEILV